MKLKQVNYNSINFTNQYLKYNETRHHFSNLTQIQNRKNKFMKNNSYNSSSFSSIKKIHSLDMYSRNEKDRNNHILQSRLQSIKNKRISIVKPNELLSSSEKRLTNSAAHKRIHQKLIDEENERLAKRLDKKPFISVKKLDKYYTENHTKQVQNLKNVKSKQIYFLPKILHRVNSSISSLNK